jgi:hypothetical protein
MYDMQDVVIFSLLFFSFSNLGRICFAITGANVWTGFGCCMRLGGLLETIGQN